MNITGSNFTRKSNLRPISGIRKLDVSKKWGEVLLINNLFCVTQRPIHTFKCCRLTIKYKFDFEIQRVFRVHRCTSLELAVCVVHHNLPLLLIMTSTSHLIQCAIINITQCYLKISSKMVRQYIDSHMVLQRTNSVWIFNVHHYIRLTRLTLCLILLCQILRFKVSYMSTTES